jgi:hypothetical protein
MPTVTPPDSDKLMPRRAVAPVTTARAREQA